MEGRKEKERRVAEASAEIAVARCKVCKADMGDAQRNVCSSELCRAEWRKLCKACKKRPRTSRKFCSDACRDSVVRYSRNQTQRPVCRAFFEENKCTDERCFFRHEAPLPREADLILSVHKTHEERISSYLEEKFKLRLTREESIVGENGKCGSLPDQVFMYALLGKQASHNVARSLRLLNEVRCDPVLVRIIQRIFISDHWAVRFRETIKDVTKQLHEVLNKRQEEKVSCRVLAHPRAVEQEVIIALQSGGIKEQLSFQSIDPQVIVYVFTGQDGTYSSAVALLDESMDSRLICNGLSRKEIGGAKVPGLIAPSKASQKLEEVLLRMDISLDPGAIALDVGASPGGWTKVLASRCRKVIAVDPGEVRVDATNVEHWPRKIQDCALADKHFNIVVCDMNVAVDELIPLTLQRLASLPPHLVLTCKRIKPQGSPRSFREGIDKLIKSLREDYKYAKVSLIHLMSNKESERTIYAKRLC